MNWEDEEENSKRPCIDPDCQKILDYSKIPEWRIGHLTGMKTKTIKCECGQINNYSVNVNNKVPKWAKGLV